MKCDEASVHTMLSCVDINWTNFFSSCNIPENDQSIWATGLFSKVDFNGSAITMEISIFFYDITYSVNGTSDAEIYAFN